MAEFLTQRPQRIETRKVFFFAFILHLFASLAVAGVSPCHLVGSVWRPAEAPA
jgi:hypothetical protein